MTHLINFSSALYLCNGDCRRSQRLWIQFCSCIRPHMCLHYASKWHWFRSHHCSLGSSLKTLYVEQIKTNGCVPVQTTFGGEVVFVYPVLQVHTTAFVVGSCEQNAFASHWPFWTPQLSKNREKNVWCLLFQTVMLNNPNVRSISLPQNSFVREDFKSKCSSYA